MYEIKEDEGKTKADLLNIKFMYSAYAEANYYPKKLNCVYLKQKVHYSSGDYNKIHMYNRLSSYHSGAKCRL